MADPKHVALLSLRALGVLFGNTGYTREQRALNFIADGIEAGRNVDEHMQRVATALAESGGLVSTVVWDDVHARIDAESEKLQSAGGTD